MPFEKFVRPKTFRTGRVIAPVISISRKVFLLNVAATKKILESVPNVTRVVLFYDRINSKIGMWFFEAGTDHSDSVSVCLRKHGTLSIQISAKSFIEHYEITEKVRELGRRRFLVDRDKDEGMNDFFVAKLE